MKKSKSRRTCRYWENTRYIGDCGGQVCVNAVPLKLPCSTDPAYKDNWSAYLLWIFIWLPTAGCLVVRSPALPSSSSSATPPLYLFSRYIIIFAAPPPIWQPTNQHRVIEKNVGVTPTRLSPFPIPIHRTGDSKNKLNFLYLFQTSDPGPFIYF